LASAEIRHQSWRCVPTRAALDRDISVRDANKSISMPQQVSLRDATSSSYWELSWREFSLSKLEIVVVPLVSYIIEHVNG
jgi:hypothetical protein